MKFHHALKAWIFGVYLIFALGAAGIASASAAGNTALAHSIVTPMISLAMTWFMVLGTPLWGWWLYNTCTGMTQSMQEFADDLTESLNRKFAKKPSPKTIGEFARLLAYDEQDSAFAVPDGIKGEVYTSGFGRCYPLENGHMHLSLTRGEYTQEELYRLARWIDVIESDLDREPLYESDTALQEKGR